MSLFEDDMTRVDDTSNEELRAFVSHAFVGVFPHLQNFLSLFSVSSWL